MASHNDTTFRGYSSDQAAEYARRRGGYPRRLIDELIKAHTQGEGGFQCVLDLGCGPGNSTREVAVHFESAIGMDPSVEMVQTARQAGGDAGKSPIQFLHGDAEACEGVADNSVDLVTAATAGHWFDMERFWSTAGRVLKPNGTVAFFTIYRIYPHPDSTPHAIEIQKVLHDLEHRTLGPYLKDGNRLVMGLYKGLQMPWEISNPCPSFSRSSYRRQVWNENGIAGDDGTFVSGERTKSLDETESSLATMSPVTRWREHHPDIANTEKDCVKVALAQIRDILKPSGTEEITMVGPTVLVTVKKTAVP